MTRQLEALTEISSSLDAHRRRTNWLLRETQPSLHGSDRRWMGSLLQDGPPRTLLMNVCCRVKVMIDGLPIVTEPTRSESTNIETIVGRLKSKRIVVPDYQRDAGQWGLEKESLFIESLLNNLTVPAFFFAETEDGSIEVVDGQQRLSTILRFANGEFSLSASDAMVYLTPHSVHYRGHFFADLPGELVNVFNDYPLTVIYLPRNIDLGTKLEIFPQATPQKRPVSDRSKAASWERDDCC